MHPVVRRGIAAALSATALAAAHRPAAAGDAPTVEARPSPAALLRDAAARVHRPASAGLRTLRATFTYTTTAFGADGRETAGELVWRAGEGLFVRFGDASPDSGLATGLLETLDRVMAGTPQLLGVSDGDALTMGADGTVEVVPAAASPLRSMGEAFGWEGAPAVRYTLGDDGLVTGILATGTPCEEARAGGMPDCVEVRNEWDDIGGAALLRSMSMRLLAGEPGARREVGLPFSRVRTAFEHAELDGARVPVSVTLDLVARLGPREVTRRDTLSLSALIANPGLDEDALEGFVPVGARPEEPQPISAAELAPAWDLATPGGTRVTSAAGEGRVTVLLFWATWCGPCKRAVPVLQEIVDLHGDEVRAFAITCSETDRTGRATGDDPEAVLREHGGRFPALTGGDDVAKTYGVGAYPTLFVIGRDGRVAWSQVGFGDGSEALRKAVADALGAAR